MEFHVHTNASLLAIGVILSQNVIRKSDQPIVYVSRFLNKVKQNYNTIERKALTIIFSLQKFRHYLLGNKFVFYVDHTTLVYLVNKPQVLGRKARWLYLFLKYDFTIVCKLSRCNCKCMSRLLDSTKPTCVPNQIIDVSLFYTGFEWLNDVKEFLKLGQIDGTRCCRRNWSGEQSLLH